MKVIFLNCLLLLVFLRVSEAQSRELIPLDAPENLTLIGVEDMDVILTWSPVKPETVRGRFRGYIVRVWNHQQSQVYAIQPDVTNTAVQFFPYSKNFMTVSVRNDKYVGPRSNTISFDAPQTAPSYPFLFEWHQLGNDSVFLQWNRPKQPNGILLGYNVYKSEMKYQGGIDEKTTIIQYVDSPYKLQTKLVGLKEGVKYQIDLTAVNCAGESEHNTLELELEPHTPMEPSIPYFKYKIDHKEFDSLYECSKEDPPIVTASPKWEIKFNQLDDDYFVLNDTDAGKIVKVENDKKQKEATTKKYEDRFHNPCVVDCLVTWVPDIDNNPGDYFYVKYRIKGEKNFDKTENIRDADHVVIKKFDGCQSYEIILVAVDGEFETESDLQMTPAVLFMTYY